MLPPVYQPAYTALAFDISSWEDLPSPVAAYAAGYGLAYLRVNVGWYADYKFREFTRALLGAGFSVGGYDFIDVTNPRMVGYSALLDKLNGVR
jgi:hypothetical protein